MTAQQILETPDLIAVGVAGDEVRRRLHGVRTTFVRVLEVHVEAPLHNVPQGAQPGEIRIVGAPSSLELAVAAVQIASSIANGIPVTGYSLADLASLGELNAVLPRLKDAGLAAIASLPLDVIADGESAAREVARTHLGLNAITLNRLEDGAWLEMCERARALQAVVPFKAFAPLPRSMSVTKPTTGYDDVKMIALARVVCTNVPSIQVDWQLYGPKMAQVALTVGADDIDNVSAVDPGILGTRRSPLEEIKRNITAAGLEPVERDGLFNK